MAKVSQSIRMQEHGFTLVEALIALAVIGLVSSAFVPLLSQGFSEVFLAGHRIRGVHETQAPVDRLVLNPDAEIEGNDEEFTQLQVDIQFPILPLVSVSGFLVRSQTQFQNRSTSIIAFVPSEVIE